MNSKNDILFELETLSPVLAGLPKSNVFSVPQGYFETLGETVLLCIKEASDTVIVQNTDVPDGYFKNLSFSILDKIKGQQKSERDELKTLSPFLYGIHAATIFEVPHGYFENLSSVILDRVKSQVNNADTEEVLSPLLLNARHLNVFEIPQGYFENLSSLILDKLNEADNLSATLLNVRHANVFEVPQGYFENLPAEIISKLNAPEISANDEILELSPLLHSLQQMNVFEVPQGYFHSLSTALQPAKAESAKVVSMHKPNMFVRLAAAAVIMGAMALGVYKFTDRQPATVSHVVAQVTTTAGKLDSSIVKGKTMNDQQFDEALNNLSKEDITNYLEKNNSEEDMAALTSDVDENALPDKDDYLLDEKTLENYLDEIKSQN